MKSFQCLLKIREKSKIRPLQPEYMTIVEQGENKDEVRRALEERLPLYKVVNTAPYIGVK